MNPLRRLTPLRHFAAIHRKASVGIAAAAIVAAGSGIGYGVSAATSAASASPTTSTSVPASGKGAAKNAKHHHVLRAQIVSISGNSWTVRTEKGKVVTVTVGSSTHFGTAASPMQQSGFAAGDKVTVLGARHGTSVTATRVALSK